MRTPAQFMQDRKATKLTKLAAEIIRISEAGGTAKPRNPDAKKVPISTYRQMMGDDEVSADLIFKETLMIPVLNITPIDSDEKAKQSALFLEQIHKRMIGSPLSYYRDMALHEAEISGMCIGEPIYQPMEIPEFGQVQGVRSITIANSEDFAGLTVMDEYGLIEKFVQDRDGKTDISPDEVAYYGNRATAGNPEGVSGLLAAHPYWDFKGEILALLKVFAAVNASGIIELKIPPALFKKEKDDALTFLEELATSGKIAMPDNWDLNIDIPPGTAGTQFMRFIQEICNKGIRKAILYDDTVNAEGMHTWGEAGKEASMNMVAGIMQSQGEEFCDSFISDQMFRMILDKNGMQDYPTPIASNTSIRTQGDPVQILDALGKAKQSGVLTVPIPDTAQTQIMGQMMDSMGVEYEPNLEDAEEDDSLLSRFERAPRGRTKTDILRTKKGRVEREEKAVVETVEVWEGLTPKISERLNLALFKGGDWKTKNLGAMREAIKHAITYGGKDLREVMTKPMLVELDIGIEEAQKSLKMHAMISTAARIDTRMAVQSLQQRVYLILEKQYGLMGDDLYYMIEQAVMGTTSPIQAQAAIERYLLENGLQVNRASTILNTALSHAHNGGRMTVYSALQDPLGQKVGSIKGYQYSAILDDRTTDLCDLLNTEFFMCNDPKLPNPPLHMNCRSMLIPVFDDEVPWDGKSFKDFSQTEEMVNRYGGIPDGFGGI